jgi:hypothetical protein
MMACLHAKLPTIQIRYFSPTRQAPHQQLQAGLGFFVQGNDAYL